MSDANTLPEAPQQLVTVLDLPRITIEMFRSLADTTITTCFASSGWYLLEVSSSLHSDPARLESRRQQLEYEFGRKIAYLVEEPDSTNATRYTREVFAPSGHVALGVVAALTEIEKIRVSFVFWDDEPFGGHFLRLLLDMWPQATTVYSKRDSSTNTAQEVVTGSERPSEQVMAQTADLYESMPTPDTPKWSKGDWRKLFYHFSSAGVTPELKRIASETGKNYDYVRRMHGRYANGELDD